MDTPAAPGRARPVAVETVGEVARWAAACGVKVSLGDEAPTDATQATD